MLWCFVTSSEVHILACVRFNISPLWVAYWGNCFVRDTQSHQWYSGQENRQPVNIFAKNIKISLSLCEKFTVLDLDRMVDHSYIAVFFLNAALNIIDIHNRKLNDNPLRNICLIFKACPKFQTWQEVDWLNLELGGFMVNISFMLLDKTVPLQFQSQKTQNNGHELFCLCHLNQILPYNMCAWNFPLSVAHVRDPHPYRHSI